MLGVPPSPRARRSWEGQVIFRRVASEGLNAKPDNAKGPAAKSNDDSSIDEPAPWCGQQANRDDESDDRCNENHSRHERGPSHVHEGETEQRRKENTQGGWVLGEPRSPGGSPRREPGVETTVTFGPRHEGHPEKHKGPLTPVQAARERPVGFDGERDQRARQQYNDA